MIFKNFMCLRSKIYISFKQSCTQKLIYFVISAPFNTLQQGFSMRTAALYCLVKDTTQPSGPSVCALLCPILWPILDKWTIKVLWQFTRSPESYRRNQGHHKAVIHAQSCHLRNNCHWTSDAWRNQHLERERLEKLWREFTSRYRFYQWGLLELQLLWHSVYTKGDWNSLSYIW